MASYKTAPGIDLMFGGNLSSSEGALQLTRHTAWFVPQKHCEGKAKKLLGKRRDNKYLAADWMNHPTHLCSSVNDINSLVLIDLMLQQLR